MGLLVTIVNSIPKSIILDVTAVCDYSEGYHPPLATEQTYCPGGTRLLSSELFLIRRLWSTEDSA